MFYIFIGFMVISIFIIIRSFRNISAIWFSMLLLGFCLSVLGLMFYSVYIWDYSYVLRKLFLNMNKNIWLFIYYLKLDSGMVMRLVNIGAVLFSYSALSLSFSLLDRNRKIGFYTATIILPFLMILIYDPYSLNWMYKVYKSNEINMTFNTFLGYINLINGIWIKLYILGSIGISIYAYRSYTNINYKKKISYMILGASPIFILYIMLFYWVPQPFIVLRDFTIIKSVNAWEVSDYLTLNFQYGRFTYIMVICLFLISVSLILFATIKYNLFDNDIKKNKLIFSSTFMMANRGVSIFSHSIKNQIVAIRMIGENLKRSMEEDCKNKKSINTLLSICDETINKLNTLRDMSIPFKLEFMPFSIIGAIREIIDQRIPSTIDINILIEESNDFTVFASRELFKEAIGNIIENSLEAFDSARPGILRVFLEKEGRWGIINIEDNGIGIPEEDVPKIFTPFFTTKPTITNWGIGLSFSKNIIETFKGEIQVNSKQNSGTLFKVFIPIYRGRYFGRESKMYNSRGLQAVE